MTSVDNERVKAGERMARTVGFSVLQAIEAGLLDDHLVQIGIGLSDRIALLRRSTPPPRTDKMRDLGQVWVWMNGPGKGHWEIRGTGFVAGGGDHAD